jgi:hypothetical protein
MFEYFNGFWKWVSDNPDKVDPSICAVYFALLNRANKTGWKDSFAIILIDLQEDCGICSRTTMLKVLSKLEEYGFVNTISKTNNQYKNRVIRLPLNGKHVESTWIPLEKHMETNWTHNKTIKDNKEYKEYEEVRVEESTLIIPKIKAKKKQVNSEKQDFKKWTSREFAEDIKKNGKGYSPEMLAKFHGTWSELNGKGIMRFQLNETWETKKRLARWKILSSSYDQPFEKKTTGPTASPNTFSRASNGLQIK